MRREHKLEAVTGLTLKPLERTAAEMMLAASA